MLGGVPADAHRGRTPPTGGEHREGAAGERRAPEAVTTAQPPTGAEPLDAVASARMRPRRWERLGRGARALWCLDVGVMTDQELVAEIERRIIDNAPLADILRMLLLLGGRLDSEALRDWARFQLDGYGPDDPLPDARIVGAPIHLDAIVGFNQIKGQHISAAMLPDFASVMKDTLEVRNSIAEIESMIENAHRQEKESITFSVPNWEAIGAELDKAQEFQHVTLMYRRIHVTSFEAIVADARNRTAELLGEMRRTSKPGGDLLKGHRMDDVVGVVVNGENNSVIVASGKRSAVKTSAQPGDKSWWDAWGKVATIITVVVGALAIVVWVAVALGGAIVPAP